MYQIDEAVKYNLKALRLERGLTQQALADLAGVSKQTVSNIEKGQGANSRTLERLAESLAISPLEFFKEPEKGAEIEYKRVSPRAAKLNREQYTAMLEKTVDFIVKDAGEKLYLISVMPTVKDMFAMNRDRLLDSLNAERSGMNYFALTAFEDALLKQIDKAIFPNESADNDLDELVED